MQDNKSGHVILVSLLLEKAINFLVMLLAARFMGISEFGAFSFVKSIVSTLLPFSGLGANHAILRYGVPIKLIQDQYKILSLSLFYGVIFTLVIILFIYKIVEINNIFIIPSDGYFKIFIFYILSYFIFDLSRNFYRVIGNNIQYAKHGIVYSLTTLILGSISLLYFNDTIFILSLVVSPLISVSLSHRKLYKHLSVNYNFDFKFWKYGFMVGLGAFINQFFLQSDILVLGFMNIDLTLIAQYKIASLVVFTFLLIPSSFFLRDFTVLVKYANNKTYLNSYLKKYLQYSLFILIFFLPLFYLFSEEVIGFVFGVELLSRYHLQNILLIGLVGGTLLRIPFANILNAVGKASWNVLNAMFTLLLTLVLLVYCIDIYGVVSAAYVISFMYCVSGLISVVMYFKYIKRCQSIKEMKS